MGLMNGQALRNPRLLGLAAMYNQRAVFYRAEVVELSGPGKFTRPDDPAARDAASQRKIR
jgi:hypothetical protein